MNHSLWLVLFTALLLQFSCKKDDPQVDPPIDTANNKIKGADLSFLPEMEASNFIFADEDGVPGDALSILASKGLNTVRIRVWHTPAGVHSSLYEVQALADRVHAAGLDVWLCIHYSDTWADPAEQETPAAWQGLSFPDLKDSVADYTRRLIRDIQPEMVQIGNEINSGILHPYGSIDSLSNFRELLVAASEAIRSENPSCKIMLHYAGPQGSEAFFSNLAGMDFDQIGISYYPRWHGKDLTALQQTLTSLKIQFQKEVIIAETAYPFTLNWDDQTTNLVGLEEHLILPDFPATSEGQQGFLFRLWEIINASSTDGFCYWAPDWVAHKGPQATDGSAWENQALFGFDGRVQPGAAFP